MIFENVQMTISPAPDVQNHPPTAQIKGLEMYSLISYKLASALMYPCGLEVAVAQ